MPKESNGSGLVSPSDEAIYQYLDEMLNDPGEGSGSTTSDKKHLKPPQTTQYPQAKQKQEPKADIKTLAIKEKTQPKVLSSPDTLLGFEKPIVVQQPAAKEPKVATADKTVVKEAVPDVVKKTVPDKEAKVTDTLPEKTTTPDIAPPPQEAKAPVSEPVPESDPDLNPDEIIESSLGNERLPPMTPWHENGRPEWAQGRFECLLFKVGGLKLAVPLVTLGSIHQIDRKFNHLPGQHDWFIGIMQTNAGNIKVLDTALCVMPEKYDPSFKEELNYVITLHGFEWGISCHEVMKSITLEPEDVKWRTHRGKRPWLAGTVVEQMCALVDTAGFHHVIYEAENKHGKKHSS